jgi:hypothetical protein
MFQWLSKSFLFYGLEINRFQNSICCVKKIFQIKFLLFIKNLLYDLSETVSSKPLEETRHGFNIVRGLQISSNKSRTSIQALAGIYIKN